MPTKDQNPDIEQSVQPTASTLHSETTEALNPTKQTPARNFCKEVAVQCSNSLGNGLLSVLRQALA